MNVSLISVEDNLISIGVRRIASWLRHNGHHVRTIYLPTVNYASIRQRMFPSFGKEYSPAVIDRLAHLVSESDIVGFSSMTNYSYKVKELITRLKRRFPEKMMVWGGVHPTVFPDDAIRHADAVCVGEGEMAFLELVSALERDADPSSTVGFWFREDGTVRKNPARPPMNNDELERLSYMDYGVKDNFILQKDDVVPLTYEHYLSFCGTNYNTIFTFGCPFCCTYCSNDVFARLHPDYARVRRPSVGHMIGELSEVKRNYPYLRSVVFMDDAFFMLPLDVIREFALRYADEIGLPFAVLGANPTTIREDKMAILIEAGMNRVRMGIQSGSPATLKLYNRKTPLRTIIKASEILARHKRELIPTAYDIILDNPYETKQNLLETIDLLSKLAPPFTLNVFSLQFLPGTQLAKKAVEDGICRPDDAVEKHFKLYKPTYLNLIVSMYGVGKVPPRVLRLLLRNKRVDSQKEYPLLAKMIYLLTLLRRSIHHLRMNDYSLLPGRFSLYAQQLMERFVRRRRSAR